MKMQHPKHRLCDWWRPFRVGWHLVKRPQDIAAYLRYGAGCLQTPLALGCPWWSFGAVRALEKLLRSDMEVFEFGSGGSTIFLAERTKSVTSVEDEAAWVDMVLSEADERSIRNLKLLLRPYDFNHTGDFHMSDYLAAMGDRKYDLIIVDGKEGSSQVRDICFWKAEERINRGGLIVVDDSWRYPQIKVRNKALRWKDYKGTGYCRAGVTSTCLFYY